MHKIIIASQNPAKVNAVRSAFSTVFPEQEWEFIGVSVASEVADQPMSDAETKLGALNRVRNAKQQYPNADYYVGLEAGIEDNKTFAWMIIESVNQRGESRSASLMLPPLVLERLQQAKELGDVMDEVFGTDNIKQKGGAIGLLTQHHLTRSTVYHQALILALIPFINPEHYPHG
ncbi:non-canonical purine NTP phosphatase [Vibrio mimicus]|nr:non-canonical purine NTP phosphatase [Vibrio mimicus]